MTTSLFSAWQFWALLSAMFAAVTAIFAKIGVTEISSNFATFVRTLVVIGALGGILTATQGWQSPATVPGRSWLFLMLSGLGTGASWVCYFRALKLGEAARVAPVDKLSVVLVAVFGVIFLGERLTVSNWLGIILIAGGSILVAWTT
jgi:bacterial/archaeal transporter family protein